MTRAVSTLCELAFESEALGCFDHVEICAAEKNLKSRAIPVRTMPAVSLASVVQSHLIACCVCACTCGCVRMSLSIRVQERVSGFVHQPSVSDWGPTGGPHGDVKLISYVKSRDGLCAKHAAEARVDHVNNLPDGLARVSFL